MKRLMFIWFLTGLFILSGVAQEEKVIKKTIRMAKKGNFIGVVLIQTNSDSHNGAKIKKVIENSPAEKAGLKDGDYIEKVDGKKVDTAKSVAEAVENKKVGDTVEFSVNRDGQKRVIKVKVEEAKSGENTFHWFSDDGGEVDVMTIRDDASEVPELKVRVKAHEKGGFLGVEARDISDQMKTYFGVKSGVLVETVLKKTPAEMSGLKAGDIITRINEKKIEDYSDLTRTLNYHDPEEEVTVEVVRHKKKKNIKVKLAKKANHFQQMIRKIKKVRAPHTPTQSPKWFSGEDLIPESEENIEVIIL